MSYLGNSPGVASQRTTTTITAASGQTVFITTGGYQLGYLDVYLNGSLLVSGDDYAATNGTSITLTQAAAVDDIVHLVSYIPRGLSDGYLKAEADAKYLTSASNISASNVTGLATVATSGSYVDLTNKPTLFSGSYTDLTNKPTLFSGSYADLTNKPDLTQYAQLVGGVIPSNLLPSYVDDVVEYAALVNLPSTGETGKIYVTTSNNKIYRWSGSAYIEVVAAPGSTDSVIEGTTNLYFTNTRARSAISATSASGANYNSTTGVISLASIPNSSLTNSAITINGTSVSLGGSISIASGGSPGGSSGQLQFNNSGSFAGLTSLTWTSGSSLFTITDADIKITESSSGLFHLAVDANAPLWTNGVLGTTFASQGISINQNFTSISSSGILLLGQGNTDAMSVTQSGRVWFGPSASASSNYNASVNVESTLVTGNTQSYGTDYCFTGVYSPTVSFSAVKESGAGGADFIGFTNGGAATLAPSLNIARGRGPHVDNQSNVTTGDTVGYVTGWGMVSYSWRPVAQLEFYIDGSATNTNAEGAIRLRTYQNGTSNIRLNLSNPGHITPGSDNAQDLGSFTARWRNIYTADMHFSNYGSQNSVDGTWGNWTLQEGEENIYMLNNRTGRRYKIALEEV